MTNEGPDTSPRAFPVSRVCPACGVSAHTKVQPLSMLAFARDRVCRACSTRYAPPTPAWGRALFALVTLGALGAAGFCVYLFFTDPMIGVKALYMTVGLVLLAAGCCYAALRREQEAPARDEGGTE